MPTLTRGGTWRTLVAGVLLVLGLSACRADVAVQATVEEDGSGLVEVVTTLDAEATAGLLDLDLETAGLPLGDLAQTGWAVDAPRPDAEGGTVIRATKEFGTPEQFSEIMADISGPDGVFQDFTLSRAKAFARVDYEVRGTLDTSGADFAPFSDTDLAAALGQDLDELAVVAYNATPRDVSVSFDVVLPGEIQQASAAGVVRAAGDGTEASWQVTLADGDLTEVAVSSTTTEVVPRVLRGVAVVTGVLALVIVFARLLRVLLPDRRRRPARRHTSDIRPVNRPPVAPAEVAPVITEQRWVAVDGLGVLFREADDVHNLLIPFARQHGSTKSEAEIEARARWLRLGRITTGEFWAAIGVPGDPEALDAAYLTGHQLSPGVIRYLRTLRERGIRLACITDEATAWAARLRAGHSLESLIEVWVVSGSVGVTKPDLPIFEVLRRVTQEPAGAILVIDDDLDVLDAARRLGYATAWFNAQGRPDQARDHQIIRSFELVDDDLVDADRP